MSEKRPAGERPPEERDQLYAQDGLYSKDHPEDSEERPDQAGPHPARERPEDEET